MLDGRGSRLALALAAFAGSAAVGIGARAAEAGSSDSPLEPRAGTVAIQLLGVNDFHGHLEPPKPGIGGAAWLAAHLDRAETEHPGRTIRVHAGDMIGASPLVSSWSHDEPSIEASNLMGFDVGTLGNHEFDEGGSEMLRMVRGGHRDDGSQYKVDGSRRRVDTSAPDFEGADYPFVAANTVGADGALVLPPYRIIERAGVRIGFIGATTTTTPNFLLRRHGDAFRFLDLSDSVNRWVPELRRQGVEAIVVLAHSGAESDGAGEIISETTAMDGAVDVVVAGHTHNRLNTLVGGKLVVQAWSYGVAFDQVELLVDRASGDVVDKRGSIRSTPHAATVPDAGVARLVDRHVQRVAPLAKRVVGRAPRSFDHSPGPGDIRVVAAEAQRLLARADVGIVHSSTVRAGIERGPVSYEELFRVGAYEHDVLSVHMSAVDARALVAVAEERRFIVAGSVPATGSVTVSLTELVRDLLPGTGGGRVMGTEVDALVRYAEENWR